MKILAVSFLLLAYHSHTHAKKLQGSAYCTYDDVAAMVSLYSKPSNKAPMEVTAYVKHLALKYGTHTVSKTGVSKVSRNAYSESYHLTNSLTSYKLNVKCVWTANIQY